MPTTSPNPSPSPLTCSPEKEYKTEYTYDLAGELTSMKYPSGRVVRTTYDAAGRIQKVLRAGGGEPYGTVEEFAAHGAIGQLKLGWRDEAEVMTEAWTYNGRLQPAAMTLTRRSDSRTLAKFEYFYCLKPGERMW